VVCESQLLNVSKLGLNGLLHVLLLGTEALISIELYKLHQPKRQHVRAAACYATTTTKIQYINNKSSPLI
jgi:hypothetical protein